VFVRSLEFRSVPDFSPSNLRLHTNLKYPQPLLPSPVCPCVPCSVSIQPELSSVTCRWLGNTAGNEMAGMIILAQTNHGRHHVCLGRHPGWAKSPRESEYNLSVFLSSFPTATSPHTAPAPFLPLPVSPSAIYFRTLLLLPSILIT
jgi:hypothetical protein